MRYRASPRRSGSIAAGNGVGTATFVPDDNTQTATIKLPIAQFGKVDPGWTFTVALTGQDGFNPDQARGFARRRRTSRSASASRAG